MLWQRMKSIVFQALAEAARNAEGVALGIISGAKGSSPQKVGAKALFYADGRIKGTLGAVVWKPKSSAGQSSPCAPARPPRSSFCSTTILAGTMA